MAIPRRTARKRTLAKQNTDLPFKPSFTKCYDVIKYLGKGGFGSVFSAVRLSDKQSVAVKVMKKNTIKEWRKVKGRKVPLEVCFLQALRGVDGVIQFYDGFNFKNDYLMIMERPKRCQDLFDFVMKFRGLNDIVAKALFRQIVETASECAARNIIHQDIKMENIVIDLDTGKAKLIDFGLSKFFKDPGEMIHSYCGTFYAAPPEWFTDKMFNGLKAAVWSLGILLYVMLTSYDPFLVDDKRVPLYDTFKIWGSPSKCAQRLFLRCLSLDPSYRPNFQEILDDPYLVDAQKPPLRSDLLKHAGALRRSDI